jgi:hypothetical protein
MVVLDIIAIFFNKMIVKKLWRNSVYQFRKLCIIIMEGTVPVPGRRFPLMKPSPVSSLRNSTTRRILADIFSSFYDPGHGSPGEHPSGYLNIPRCPPKKHFMPERAIGSFIAGTT